MQTRKVPIVRRIAKSELIEARPFQRKAKRAVFEYEPEKRIMLYRMAVKNAGYTWKGRYPLLNAFLSAYKTKIRVFADVGAGNVAGAPTTTEARDILGPQAKIFAVDRRVNKTDLSMSLKGVQQLKHRITQGPLPFQCDAIRFANVSEYLTETDLVKALDNIWHSLKPRGFLLSAGPQDILQEHGVSLHNETILVKVKKTKRHPFGFVRLNFQPN